jgi:hypothetical protein
VPSLSELVSAHVERWQTASVELGVFGAGSPEEVARHFELLCADRLGSEIDSGLFYGSSAGCVAGVRLMDGREVVVKAYQPSWGEGFLGAVGRVQARLEATGFPCPTPVLGPVQAGPALAMVESRLPDPGMRVLEGTDDLAASATGLADLIDRCRSVEAGGLADHPMRADSGLYPTPHNPLFDFTADVERAAWIDELAAAAIRGRLGGGPVLIGHTDWSARNIRVEHGTLVAAYDWDSVALVAEPTIVGQAAATWRSTGEADDPIAPDAGEVLEYLAAYERAAGTTFDENEVRATLASALWVLAYTARCEHALESVTGRRVERARARLAADGARFLELTR